MFDPNGDKMCWRSCSSQGVPMKPPIMVTLWLFVCVAWSAGYAKKLACLGTFMFLLPRRRATCGSLTAQTGSSLLRDHTQPRIHAGAPNGTSRHAECRKKTRFFLCLFAASPLPLRSACNPSVEQQGGAWSWRFSTMPELEVLTLPSHKAPTIPTKSDYRSKKRSPKTPRVWKEAKKMCGVWGVWPLSQPYRPAWWIELHPKRVRRSQRWPLELPKNHRIPQIFISTPIIWRSKRVLYINQNLLVKGNNTKNCGLWIMAVLSHIPESFWRTMHSKTWHTAAEESKSRIKCFVSDSQFIRSTCFRERNQA